MVDLLKDFGKQIVDRARDDALGGWDGGEFFSTVAVWTGTAILAALYQNRFWWFAAVLILPAIAYIYYVHSLFSDAKNAMAKHVPAFLGLIVCFLLILGMSKLFSDTPLFDPFLIFSEFLVGCAILYFMILLIPRYSPKCIKKSSTFLLTNALSVSILCLSYFSAYFEHNGQGAFAQFNWRMGITFAAFFSLLVLYYMRILVSFAAPAKSKPKTASKKTGAQKSQSV